MAKIQGPWLRGARKKLAGVVLQKGTQGGTVAREWVIPNNPQTALQMSQRILFSTVAQARKFLRPIINHSFEGIEYGVKSEQAFASKNIEQLRSLAAIDFAETPVAADAHMFTSTKGVSALVPNAYIISDGSLSAPALYVQASADVAQLLHLKSNGFTLPLQQTTIQGGTAYGITLGQLLSSVLGITGSGEMLTLCGIVKSSDEYRYTYNNDDSLGFQIPYTVFNAKRLVTKSDLATETVIVISNNGTQLLEDAIESLQDAMSNALDDTKTDQAFKNALLDNFYTTAAGMTITNGQLVLTNPVDLNLDTFYTEVKLSTGGGHCYAAGVIRSQFVENSWRRSKCILAFTAPSEANNCGLLWAITLDAWFNTQRVRQSTRFLNEGLTQNQVGENFTGGVPAPNLEYIDLGLPSGLLWARWNLGASAPAEPGLFFSWGNVEGVTGDSEYQFTEQSYQQTAGHSIEENLTGGNDAATVILGQMWRMPTKEDVQELFENCNIEWTSINGVNGNMFTSNLNGRKLFFPASGVKTETLTNVNVQGHYWCSSYQDTSTAWQFVARASNPISSAFDRRYGFTIRPVRTR